MLPGDASGGGRRRWSPSLAGSRVRMREKPASAHEKARWCGLFRAGINQALTGILPIFACQIFGAVLCTEEPFTSTATDTGMSSTTNS